MTFAPFMPNDPPVRREAELNPDDPKNCTLANLKAAAARTVQAAQANMAQTKAIEAIPGTTRFRRTGS